jgi:hypothetical protein
VLRELFGVGDYLDGIGARDEAYLKMLIKGLNQRGRDRPPILIDHREHYAAASLMRLSGYRDDHDHHNRNNQHTDESKMGAADEPKVFQHYSYGLHVCVSPLGLPNFRRINAIKSSGVIRDSTRLN